MKLGLLLVCGILAIHMGPGASAAAELTLHPRRLLDTVTGNITGANVSTVGVGRELLDTVTGNITSTDVTTSGVGRELLDDLNGAQQNVVKYRDQFPGYNYLSCDKDCTYNLQGIQGDYTEDGYTSEIFVSGTITIGNDSEASWDGCNYSRDGNTVTFQAC